MNASLIAHAVSRGLIGGMVMTGMEAMRDYAGLSHERSWNARVRRLLGRPRRDRRRAAAELAHWAYAGAGGVLYALLPPEMAQRRARSGLAYGLLAWSGSEAGVAPALRVRDRHQRRLVERASRLADHLVYGLLVAEARRRAAD